MKKIFIITFLLCVSCKKDNNSNEIKNILSDSIVYSKYRNGDITKTIFYPSRQKDSFKLRSYYINEKLVDSMYITDSGYKTGNAFVYKEDGTVLVYEHLNSKSVNQFWAIKDRDTLSNYGNYYIINSKDSIKKNTYFNIEILLKRSFREDFTELFFLLPKKGSPHLKTDFSNMQSVKFDTLRSIVNDEFLDNKLYKEDYWNKRSIVYSTGFANSGVNYIRGVLVEKKDSLHTNKNGNKLKDIATYLYVEKEVYVTE